MKTRELSIMEAEIIASVRDRLHQWQDYHDGGSIMSPRKSYGPTDRVAYQIYQARKPLFSINTPDPRLNLDVPDAIILLMFREQIKEETEFLNKIYMIHNP